MSILSFPGLRVCRFIELPPVIHDFAFMHCNGSAVLKQSTISKFRPSVESLEQWFSTYFVRRPVIAIKHNPTTPIQNSNKASVIQLRT